MGDEGAGDFGEADDSVHAFAPPKGVSARDCSDGPQLVRVCFEEFIPEVFSTDVVVALLGGEDGGDDEYSGHGIVGIGSLALNFHAVIEIPLSARAVVHADLVGALGCENFHAVLWMTVVFMNY